MSLKGINIDINGTNNLLNAIEDAQKGKPNSLEKLYEYVENGIISAEYYEETKERYYAACQEKELKEREKRKTTKTLFFLFVVFILILATSAILYHNYAMENSYNEGKSIGYNDGYQSGKSIGYNEGYQSGKSTSANVVKSQSNNKSNASYESVVVTANGTKYHKSNCFHIKNRNTYTYSITTAKAKGYTPCKTCFG